MLILVIIKTIRDISYVMVLCCNVKNLQLLDSRMVLKVVWWPLQLKVLLLLNYFCSYWTYPFSDQYIELSIKRYIPVKTVTIRHNAKPWFNSSIGKAMRVWDSLHKQLKRTYSISLLSKYQTQRRKVWKYQMGNQKPYIEGHTIQWPKENVLKNKQRPT